MKLGSRKVQAWPFLEGQFGPGWGGEELVRVAGRG
jgi:hypothetical protein